MRFYRFVVAYKLLVDFIRDSKYSCITFIELDTIMIFRHKFTAYFTGEINYHVSFLLMGREQGNKRYVGGREQNSHVVLENERIIQIQLQIFFCDSLQV